METGKKNLVPKLYTRLEPFEKEMLTPLPTPVFFVNLCNKQTLAIFWL